MANFADIVNHVALVLVVIGCVNWGLAIFNFNVVEWLQDQLAKINTTFADIVAKVIYALVAAAGIYAGVHEWFIQN